MSGFTVVRLQRGIAAAAVVFLLLIGLAGQARATDIQRVVSPGGIEAWLVEEHNNPLIAVQFAFRGGASADPADTPGVANMLSGLLDEGAGELDSRAFQLALEETAARLSFSASADRFSGSLTTLTSRRDEAFELLRLALAEARFDDEPVERIRTQIIAGLKRASTDPDRMASRQFFSKIYPEHPYGRPSRGTEESVAAITVDDLKAYRARVMARDTLKIGVVGDIDAETLGPLLDTVFGGLPAQGALGTVADVAPNTAPPLSVVDLDVPQASILFGLPGLKRDDPDFITAFVVNHIFGGGSFSSRLYREVREDRGLVYSVYSYLYPLDHAGALVGGAGTQNARVKESLDVIRAEVALMGADGPSAEELDRAKRFLIGAYPLRFDTSGKIARQLVSIQMEDLGIDYIDRRNSLVEAVTLEDAIRVAKALYDPEKLVFTVVGRPEGDLAAPTDG